MASGSDAGNQRWGTATISEPGEVSKQPSPTSLPHSPAKVYRCGIHLKSNLQLTQEEGEEDIGWNAEQIGFKKYCQLKHPPADLPPWATISLSCRYILASTALILGELCGHLAVKVRPCHASGVLLRSPLIQCPSHSPHIFH